MMTETMQSATETAQEYQELDILVDQIFTIFDKFLTFQNTELAVKKLLNDYELIFGENDFTVGLKQTISDSLKQPWGFGWLKKNILAYINNY